MSDIVEPTLGTKLNDAALTIRKQADEITRLKFLLEMREGSLDWTKKQNFKLIETCENARKTIKTLRAELAEAEAVIKPFAECMKGAQAQFMVSDVERAAAWLEGRKG